MELDTEIDAIYWLVDRLASVARFEAIDGLLVVATPLDDEARVAWLMATLPMRSKLPGRAAFCQASHYLGPDTLRGLCFCGQQRP